MVAIGKQLHFCFHDQQVSCPFRIGFVIGHVDCSAKQFVIMIDFQRDFMVLIIFVEFFVKEIVA